MSELTDVIDGLTSALEDERTTTARLARDNIDQHEECKRLRTITVKACARGMAAIATYGRRDEQGLTGLSRQHYRELGELMKEAEGPSLGKDEGPLKGATGQ